jgi:hypothetical protein
MQKYIIHADKRRPLKFEGVLLGKSTSKSDEELGKLAVVEAQSLFHTNPKRCQDVAFLRLALYRTKAEKVILETVRFGAFMQVDDNYDPGDAFFPSMPRTSIDVYESLEVYIEAAVKQGRVTVALLENVIQNHPELENFWVESID